jgi:hypothetical protein
MTRGCNNCAALLIEEGLRPSLGIDWLCARCGEAGTYSEREVGGRTVTLREVMVHGDSAMRRDWVPAESMPYAERVRPIGGGA